ncbi:MAG: HIT family protein [Geobacteraceae bacterium]|nr:HIT family protein [Geobacteraceae bacterium]NTW78929.1 HIT family protein [Geobacteraceae bacterium]
MPDCPMCSRWDDDSDLRIIELPNSYAILNRDQYFPGYTLLFTRTHATELFHLDRGVRTALMEEVSAVAQALYTAFAPDKINYELLGNMVPHIHWHIVPRFSSEPLWPRPIWAEQHEELLLSPDEYRQRIETIRSAII